MLTFHRGDVVLDQATQSHYLESVIAENVLIVILQRYIKKRTGEEDNDDSAGGGAREEFKMKMFFAKKPIEESPGEGRAGALGWINAICSGGKTCHNCHKAEGLPVTNGTRPRVCSP